MQTPILPVQPSNAAAPAPQARAAVSGASPDSDFQRTLNRQIEQRQTQNQKNSAPVAPPKAPPAQAAAPAPAPVTHKPAAPAPAAQAQAPARGESGAAKPVQNEATVAETSTAPTTTTTTTVQEAGNAAEASADASASSEASAETRDALSGPVADMLALVASLTQQNTAAATTTLPADTGAAAAGGADAARADLLGKGAVLGTALPAVGVKAAPVTDTAAGAKASASTELLPEAATPEFKTEAAAAGVARSAPDAAQLGAVKTATFSAELLAATREPAAGVSAVTAPVQQASLEIAQAASAIPTDKLMGRVGTPAWDQQLGQKVIFMAAGGEQSASLMLNPPDLGPLQVVLHVSNDQTSASFTSAQPEVRQALEAALPRLREMMSEAGIQLGSATVSAGNPGQQNQADGDSRGARGARGGNGNDSDSDTTVAAVPAARGRILGAVDTFA